MNDDDNIASFFWWERPGAVKEERLFSTTASRACTVSAATGISLISCPSLASQVARTHGASAEGRQRKIMTARAWESIASVTFKPGVTTLPWRSSSDARTHWSAAKRPHGLTQSHQKYYHMILGYMFRICVLVTHHMNNLYSVVNGERLILPIII